ncbi:hypothetical protein [Roseimicrobium gellanilyticum]|uniref:hypothetical protein n=1 Tax=Roseimicrobium gellanilyticum TaxID=748857 RepID=UPI0014754848|nr:hypothetical protein [Roseimicrobium gellanilyticum]
MSPRWRYKDCDFTKATILPDFNALYVSHRTDFDLDHYFFLRFWPGGQVSMRALGIPGRLPTASEGDEFSLNTAVGYYCIDGNEIKLEVLGIDGLYHLDKGTISPNAIAIEGLYKLEMYKRVDYAGALKNAPTW